MLLERVADPGFLIFHRDEPDGLELIETIGSPMTVRKFAIQRRRRGLGLGHDAERQIAFLKPEERFRGFRRRLEPCRHDLEAIDGAGVVAAVHVIEAYFHLVRGVRPGSLFGLRR
jgi:hypothetical protein